FGIYNSPLHAAIRTWDGGGADDNLSNAINWIGDIAPASTDSVTFTGAIRTTPSVDLTTLQYVALNFDAGASAFTIGGTNALTLGSSTTAGNYLNNDTVGLTQTINAPIKLNGGQINANQGNLVLNGLFNIG